VKHYKREKSNCEKWIRFRIGVVGTVLALCFGVIIGRAVQLQVLDGGKLSAKAEGEYKKSLRNVPRRGTIYDQNNEELAVSIDVASICAYPKRIPSPKQTAVKLAKALNMKQAPLLKRLTSEKRFVWIKRKVPPKAVATVKALELDGIDFVTESRRFYPMKTLAAQVLGFCGTDRRGLEGVEFQYDPLLGGSENNWTVFRDALGRSFKVESAAPGTKDGYNLILTIDKNIQHMAEQALCETVEEYGAKSGMAVVMDPKTGAVLAMAHAPQFNPNTFGQYEPWLRRNRAITDSFEPGSTFKIFLGAAALESGRIAPDSTIDCEEGRYQIGGNVVHDVHAHGALSFQDILKYSSNIGAAKIGSVIGSDYLHNALKAFGFGARTGVDCPGETLGSLLPLERWSDMDAMAICFGQGVSVSALQLTAAVSAIANDGVLMKPYLLQAMTDSKGRLVRSYAPSRLRRVVSVKTARTLTQMLERVVAKGGTGQNAALRGYRVAGKTGTAQKVDPVTRRYAKAKHIAAFAGFVPSRDPAVVIAVIVDEPKKHYYGGVVAAPVFRRVARECLQYLKIPPELVIPEEKAKNIKASREEMWMG
jgi:cell division protein FtsI (penicillin-binding protein 3)